MANKRKKVKISLTEAQKKDIAKKKKETAFKRKIRTTFTDMGFTYLQSE